MISPQQNKTRSTMGIFCKRRIVCAGRGIDTYLISELITAFHFHTSNKWIWSKEGFIWSLLIQDPLYQVNYIILVSPVIACSNGGSSSPLCLFSEYGAYCVYALTGRKCTEYLAEPISTHHSRKCLVPQMSFGKYCRSWYPGFKVPGNQ